MRFVHLRIDRFGPIRRLDTGEEELPGLVVVHGPNEAGKTSVFTALRTLLHGFYPASREGNPFAPWDGEDAEVRAVLESREGGRASVHRRLLSAPWGRLEADGETEDIRNESVPWARHLPRGLYEQMFTISLPQLARLQDASEWAAVRDRLVTGMEASDLLAPGPVADALEQEANQLWRPRRNRHSKEWSLESEEAALRTRLSQARERDRSLRQASRRVAEVGEELERLSKTRSRLQGRLERVRRLLPAGDRLDRLDRLLEEAGDASALEGLPRDPVQHLEELIRAGEEGEERRSEARRQVEELRQAVPEPDRETEALLEQADEVRGLVAHAPVVSERRSRLDGMRRRLRELDDELEPLGADLFGRPERPVSAAAVRGLSLADIRAHVRDLETVAQRRAHVEELLSACRARPAPPHPGGSPGLLTGAGILTAALLAAGLLLLVGPETALGGDPGASTPLGILLLLAGAAVGAGTWARWNARRDRLRDRARELAEREEEVRELERRLEELESSRLEAGEQLSGLLAELPLRLQRLERPGPDLPRELERVRDLLRERERISRDLEAAVEEDRAVRARIAAVRRRAPEVALPAEPERALVVLEERLRAAESRAEERVRAVRSVEQAERELARVEEEAQRRNAELEAFEAELRVAAPGTPPLRAALRARERQEALDDARRIRRELEEDFGDLSGLRDRVARVRREEEGAAGGLSGGDGLRREELERELVRRLREVETRIGALTREEGTLETELRPREGEETADVLEAETLRIREERSELRRERDRLWLLARAVRRAEQRFRDAHQPELVRRAGGHLARITGGRYERLLLGDGSDGDALLLRAPHLPGPLPVAEPISTGTCEQVYLALRLAIVELVEGEAEPLPLILDEILVNWDAERRSRGLDLLVELSRGRQVFLFTCDTRLALEVEARGGRRVELEASSAAAAAGGMDG